MKIVFNTSPLIFLSRLKFLDNFLVQGAEYYVPQAVFEEILAKRVFEKQESFHGIGCQYANTLTAP